MNVGQTVALRSGVTTQSEGGGLCIVVSTNVASIWLGVSHIFPCDSDSYRGSGVGCRTGESGGGGGGGDTKTGGMLHLVFSH